MTGVVRFRFFGDLNDFLPEAQRSTWIEYTLDGSADGAVSVKHAIEAIGAPHPEVDQIIVNGAPAGFAHWLRPGEQIAVYPVGFDLPIPTCKPLRPPLDRPPRFLLDTHLGRLAAYLRMLGFDASYNNHADDEQLAALADDERRVLLTRDRGLLKRKLVTYGYCVRQSQPRAQLVAVIRRFGLAAETKPWTRCVRCNGLLESVDKAEILHLLEPKTKLYYDAFQRCTDCGQIYWRGSHHDRMRSFLAGAVAEANAAASSPAS